MNTQKISLVLLLMAGILVSACTSSIPGFTSPPVTISVTPGGGNHDNLQALVDAAPPGSTLVLGIGSYHLARPLDIRKSLHLIGAGIGQTEIVSTAQDYVIMFDGDGPFSAEGIAFRHEGELVADVLVVQGGQVFLSSCRFTGANQGGLRELKAGLRLRRNTTGVVEGCIAEENDSIGILLEEYASVILRNNICQNNKNWGVGILYAGNAGGTAYGNQCLRNATGIYAGQQSQPTLRENRCRENHTGIRISGQSQPTLEGNICISNTEGIDYSESAGGIARGNISSGNGDGIVVTGQSMPTLEDNQCDNNLTGIYIGDQAQPVLQGNVCRNNRAYGIEYGGNSTGTARQNECSRNIFGIYVGVGAQPVIEENICSNNVEVGITYWGNGGGVARRNKVFGNKIGILIGERANPHLEDNECFSNIEADILDQRQR